MKSIKLFYTLSFVALLSLPTLAQRTMGGAPYQWGSANVTKHSIASVALPPPNKNLVKEIAEDQDPSDQEFRYGFQRLHHVDVLADGSWHYKANGGRICLFSIKSPGAAMLSVQFSDFDLEPGAMLYLYNKNHTEFLGGFTEANELPTGDFATAVVQGEEVIIEYHEPVTRISTARSLVVEAVTHGVVDIFELNKGRKDQQVTKDYWPGYPSATCHNNIVCPIASGWEDAASSVAMFLRPDGGGCTGIMVNNTANDGTPYFYLANHCYQPTESQWVFYFNYDSPTCVGDTGQTTETIVGAYFRAAEHFADFVLLELFNAPHLVYDVYYSGWSRDTVTTPTLAATIMHPAFDVKKLTIDYGPTIGQGIGNGLGASTPTWITSWDSGIVEHGASGGPIFNQDKRVMGNLADAWGDCTIPAGIVSSKFGYQWHHGPIPSQRLKEWLDPGNTDTISIDGFGATPPSAITVPLQLMLEGPYDAATGLMADHLRAASLIPLSEPYSGLGFTHYGDGGSEATTAGVLAATGNDAVVDWIFVELRNKLDSTQIMSSRTALLLRDGRVVDTDGVGELSFLMPADDYYIAVRHRNHMAIMSAGPIALSSSTAAIDLRDGSQQVYGGASNVMSLNGTTYLLTLGDINTDLFVKYAGNDNDRDLILLGIGGGVPTNTVVGYHIEDVNMDGIIKYVGNDNDRDDILQVIGGSIPTAVLEGQLP